MLHFAYPRWAGAKGGRKEKEKGGGSPSYHMGGALVDQLSSFPHNAIRRKKEKLWGDPFVETSSRLSASRYQGGKEGGKRMRRGLRGRAKTLLCHVCLGHPGPCPCRRARRGKEREERKEGGGKENGKNYF